MMELLAGGSAQEDAGFEEQLCGVVHAEVHDARAWPIEQGRMLAELAAQRHPRLEVRKRQPVQAFGRGQKPERRRVSAYAWPQQPLALSNTRLALADGGVELLLPDEAGTGGARIDHIQNCTLSTSERSSFFLLRS
jgi:hypothetical protein